VVGGQVAGIAAALSVSNNVRPKDLSVGIFKRKLVESGLLEEKNQTSADLR
jgi:hypothetical protein